MEKKGEEGKGGAKAGQQLMNTVVIERLGIGSLTNRAALPPPPIYHSFAVTARHDISSICRRSISIVRDNYRWPAV